MFKNEKRIEVQVLYYFKLYSLSFYIFTYVIQKSTHGSGAFSGHTVYGYKNFLVSY